MARSLTSRSTNPKIMDDNIKLLDDALGTVNAETIPYDNTDSGLTADDVQSAIDEIVGGIKEDFLVVTTALPSDVSSLELNSNLDLYVDEDLTGYGFVAMYAVTYDHINQINSRYLEYPVAYDTTEQKWEVVCQVLTKVFSSVYNSATVYLLFKKII